MDALVVFISHNSYLSYFLSKTEPSGNKKIKMMPFQPSFH